MFTPLINIDSIQVDVETTGYKDQHFLSLRESHLETGSLFEDPEFPSNDESLFCTKQSDRSYVWLRPKEICDDPHFFVEGFSRFDVQQGDLGDCWLLAAVTSLTHNAKLFYRVVCDDNSLDRYYAGVCHFR